MITNTKIYTKTNKQATKKKTARQNPRTNGKNKAIQTKSHKETYTYTLTKRVKAKNTYIYIFKKRRNSATKSINKPTNDNKI